MHPTRHGLWLIAAAAIFHCVAATAGTPPDAAHRELNDAIQAMGGVKVLRHIQRVHLVAHGYRNMLEQSERPEGPWIPDFSHVDQQVDFARHEVRTTVTGGQWTPPVETFVSNGVAVSVMQPESEHPRTRPGRRTTVRQAGLRMALGPERVLLTALAASDLHAEPVTHLQHVPQKVLAFTWHKAPVHLFLNAHTALPTAVEITRPHPCNIFWNLWGDVTTRIYYSFWSLEAGGLRYPMQWDVWRNGQHASTRFIDKLALNPPPSNKSPTITEAERKAFQRQGTIDQLPLRGKAETIAPGIVLLPGSWNTTLVAQSDGIVVLEAPISSGYSHKVIEEAKRLFPDRPIKAVVTTSSSWPHVGGLREYVAERIPLYVLDWNVPLVQQVLDAPHKMRPDALARHPQDPHLHAVSTRTVIGSGSNRIVLYPARSDEGERMMFAYFPNHKLLYASDMVQPMPKGGLAFPEYLYEVAHVVARERLKVDRVFAMHTPHPLPWETIRHAIAKAVAPASP